LTATPAGSGAGIDERLTSRALEPVYWTRQVLKRKESFMFTGSRRVPVKNRDRAIAFYSALLGVDLERQSTALSFEERGDDGSPLLHFNVAKRLDDALAFVWSNGGRVLEPEPIVAGHNRCVLVMDCEGNRIALYTDRA
jgi:predicted enzyme related to lactoylglutathione lyase